MKRKEILKKAGVFLLAGTMFAAVTGCRHTDAQENASNQKSKTEKQTEAVTEESTESLSEETMEEIPEVSGEALTEEITEEMSEAQTEEETELPVIDLREDAQLKAIYDECIAPREANGEVWAVSIVDLGSGQRFEYNGERVMQSASVVKLFIMASIYDRLIEPEDESKRVHYTSQYDGEVHGLLQSMITVSDNDAANRLTEILGEGNFRQGTEVIADFCRENGFGGTSMGRRFLESNPSGDNYISAADTAKLLSEIYHGTLVSENSSAEMLGYLKNQTVRYKIPAGLSEGFSSANKTGEMPEGYGLGCIENDAAIIWGPERDYVLVVLSNNLGGRNGDAQYNIQRISQIAAGILK